MFSTASTMRLLDADCAYIIFALPQDRRRGFASILRWYVVRTRPLWQSVPHPTSNLWLGYVTVSSRECSLAMVILVSRSSSWHTGIEETVIRLRHAEHGCDHEFRRSVTRRKPYVSTTRRTNVYRVGQKIKPP